ncbi:MAG: stage V sporulation protein S, partial [Dethiobacter sp.]|nr:stage V sporulation protein S [Dethiobacter sp.]
MENNIELRVGGKTAPSLLKSSIVGHVKSGKTVQIDSIGVAA